MKRQQSLKHRLQTLGALRDAVGAMRSLSAHHFRRARQALASARSYRNEINTIIAEIGIRQTQQTGAPAGMLVLSSDLGLCGDYNSRLSQVAIAEAQSGNVKTIYSVGRRARAALTKSSLVPARNYDAPVSLEGLSRLLVGLSQDILDDYVTSKIGSLQVISAGFEGVGHFSPLSVRILPIEPVVSAKPLRPSPYMDSAYLRTVAVREYLYITLYEIVLDAIASEHGMRLMAAESALEWLDSTSEATSRFLSAAKSEASTQELLDIVSGSQQRKKIEAAGS